MSPSSETADLSLHPKLSSPTDPPSASPHTADPDPLAAGRVALAEGRWQEAFDTVRAHVNGTFSACALELLGLTAWYVDNAEAAFDAFDAAYRLSVDAGDGYGAARAALWVVACRTTFKDQTNIATGWLRRVYDGLDRTKLSPELGWMRIRECEMALQMPSAGIKKSYISARKATEIGRRLGELDLQVVGLSIEGLTLMAGGRLQEGAERLVSSHEAIADGRFTHHFAAATAYSMIVDAYERVRQYDEMEAWCARSQEFCTRWDLKYPLAICRTQHAGALMARGRWAEAEAELALAADELSTARPGLLGRAFVRLGELRRRQGRLIEATTLFERAAGQSAAALCQVSLLIDRGNATRGFYVVNRIRRWVLPENRAGRIAVQEVASRASLALPDMVKASEAIEEIQQQVQTICTPAFLASAAFSRGQLQHATGDLDGAIAAFADAKQQFTDASLPYDAVRASVELAYALGAAGAAGLAGAAAGAAGAAAGAAGAAGATGTAVAAGAASAAEPEGAAGVSCYIDAAIAEGEAARAAAEAMNATPLAARAADGVKLWRDGASAAAAAAAGAAGAGSAVAAGARKGGGMFSARRAVAGIGAVRRPAPAPKTDAPVVPAARVAAQALGLSVREYRILKMLADGRTVQDIAQAIRGGVATIDRDLANLMRKLGAPSRAAAIATAKDRGLV
jgi:LuxR family transcriptional regulator, maltose regulon positive regulatory protein